jgi:predicted anti-sigma-YlaC factor YlaD
MTMRLFDRPGCASRDRALGAYVDGELQARARRRLEAHLASCRRCAAEVEQLRSLQAQVRRHPTASLSDREAEGFWPAVERKIREAEVARAQPPDRIGWLLRQRQPLVWGMAAVAGAAVLLVVGELLFRPSISTQPLAPPTEPQSTVIVESLEGGPRSSVFLLSTPDQRLKIIWVREREHSSPLERRTP